MAELLEIPCKNCGSSLKYKPNTHHLVCESCGTVNEIEQKDVEIVEIDFEEYINETKKDESNYVEEIVIDCPSCGAQSTFNDNETAGSCDFCGTPLVAKDGHPHKQLKPEYLLPFRFHKEAAVKCFQRWVKSRYFLPKELKKAGGKAENLHGVYIPFWTFDAKTITDYEGKKGTTNRENNSTKWRNVSGRVDLDFDDILIPAINSIPRKKVDKLEPWKFDRLVQHDNKYISGFKAQHYSTDLEDGYKEAKSHMYSEINWEIKRDIGGDKQRIEWSRTDIHNVTFKHILLPIWICNYRFNDKVYQVVINGDSGKVKGERPISWKKVILLALLIILGMFGFFLLKVGGAFLRL